MKQYANLLIPSLIVGAIGIGLYAATSYETIPYDAGPQPAPNVICHDCVTSSPDPVTIEVVGPTSIMESSTWSEIYLPTITGIPQATPSPYVPSNPLEVMTGE